ncbi:MAG: penicillin-binding protein 2 [Rickettsiaceae bacterium]|nr:penicillin-binding protein 2 [Rickettsiaceae bacterium]
MNSYLSSWVYSRNERVKRLLVIAIFFCLGYLIIIYNLILTNFQKDDKNANFALNQSTRGEILDRNNHVLASNLMLASVYANPPKVVNIRFTVQKLASVIKDLDQAKLTKDLSSNKNFIWVKRDITSAERDRINELGLAGIFFTSEEKRIYTQGSSMSHILGYVDRDNNGIAGVEKFFDKHLKGENGTTKNMILSIDHRIQNIVSEELDDAIAKYSALGGSCIVADVQNGEVLAIVSKPDFDPHLPSKATAEQLFNRSTLGVYEMGSVSKILTFTAGLDSKIIDMRDVYNIHDFHVGKYKIKDTHRRDGWNTVPQIFMNSSNIGTATMLIEIGKENFVNYMEKLGMLKQLTIEVPERAMPLFPKKEKITDLNLITMSYGYGFATSPAHFVEAMIPIVNGGLKYPLTLVKDAAATPIKILDSQTSENIVKLMRVTVEKGTGKKAAVQGYLVSGKTGTAEKLGPKGYLANHRYSSFVATFPSISPKIIIYFFLDDPRGIKENFGFAGGGFTAAHSTGKIIARIGPLCGIAHYDENDPHIKNIMQVDSEVDSET